MRVGGEGVGEGEGEGHGLGSRFRVRVVRSERTISFIIANLRELRCAISPTTVPPDSAIHCERSACMHVRAACIYGLHAYEGCMHMRAACM